MQALKNEKKVVSSLCNKRWVWIRESGSESTNMSVWLENEESTKGSSNGCKRLLSWDRRLTNYASVLKFMNLMESTHAPQRTLLVHSKCTFGNTTLTKTSHTTTLIIHWHILIAWCWNWSKRYDRRQCICALCKLLQRSMAWNWKKKKVTTKKINKYMSEKKSTTK